MKKLFLLLLLITNGAFSQGNYYLHNNSSSVTILPSQISAKHPLGEFNTSVGQDALKVNTRDFNTAVGYRALYNNASTPDGGGDDNTAIGVYSLLSNTTGFSNIGLGKSSLQNNTVGYWNIAIGTNALDENVGGYTNVAIGYDAVGRATSANYNTAVGTYAMRFSAGGFNTALGGNALAGNGFTPSNGTLNVALGYGASYANISGSNNVAVGYDALNNNTTGNSNVAIGYNAGYSETGSNRLYIDNSGTSSPLIGGNFSTDKIGINRSMANLDSRSENFQVQGSAFITGNLCAASYNCVSDFRYKKNISRLQNSLTNLLTLRGVNYDWRIDEFPEQAFTSQRQTGFIAQELEQVYPEMVATDVNGFKSVDYARLTPVLVEAIKELNEKVLALEKGNEVLKSENARLKKQFDLFEVRLQNLEKEEMK
ncbi:tail fiber domain-containing protein [Emticicia sp. BO119]|uniref:tail fiber domain-containing protein n=1 Tax=Emticicia sp. BO119 TaxID=2757768 RepID=UPI0015F0CBA1|nr:tail fiber domain-containing protein [Emticicia sp. BO119]MBA4851787.1 tail fiber domain-containing protein [Emticicia sp. BO119]